MSSVTSLNVPGNPLFNLTKVLKKEILNYASLGDNSNKFYKIELQEGAGTYPYRIYTEYGRMGKTPRQDGRYYMSQWQAESEYDLLISQKERKGYHKVDVGLDNSSLKVDVKTKSNKLDLSKIEDKVLKLIGKLYDNATSYIVKSVNTPLGKLSIHQVREGLRVLQEIEDVLNQNKPYALERLSNEFYSIIPVIFGSRVDYHHFLIDSFQKLNDHKDLLGVMDSVVQAQQSLEKTLEEKYKDLKIKLKALSHQTKEYKRIVDLIRNTKGSNHHFGIEVLEIYEVEDMKGYDVFNPYKVSTMELFHGTRNENMLSIMQNGLKIKPESAVKNGEMFGTGIYTASSSTKSANYCWGFDSNGTEGERYLMICEVATGKIKEYFDAQSSLTAAPHGYNSVKGVKGRSLIHDEYIVYHENQVKIKYIVEFKKA